METKQSSFLDNLGLDGWEGLENAPEMAKVQQDENALKAYETARMIAGAVTSPEGVLFMAWLKSMTADQPCFSPQAIAGNYAAEQGFFREGQNSVYRDILRQIEVAHAGPHTAQESNDGN